ncbi:MAG: hypothetical protein GEU71_05870 [Actinobacteria bacterium]|jgi:copper chaperone|nr:hypothetical protein [Actinomycetota bacterium]
MMTTFTVPDMTCDHCRGTVEKALLAIAGVQAATVDLETKSVAVDHDSTVPEADLAEAVGRAGYSVVGIER